MFEAAIENETIIISGSATYKTLPKLITYLDNISETIKIINIEKIEKVDTSVLVFLSEFASKNSVEIHCSKETCKLLEMVRKNIKANVIKEKKEGFFYSLGYGSYLRALELYMFFAFIGESFVDLIKIVLNPKRIKLTSIASDIERMGINAIPIISVLSLLIGIVIAYQSSIRLKEFGANIFIVDLISISIIRELGPLMVSITMAGRSSSSYTAQIGIMKVTEEIDVIKTMGLKPFDVLIFPKIVSMVISMPLLVVLSDIMGVVGGMIVAYLSLNVTPYDFILRLQVVLTDKIMIAGFIKTPIFAFLIATIGCYKGFRTKRNVESIGKNVTISVVDSIFSVIAADAIFSVLFRWAGI